MNSRSLGLAAALALAVSSGAMAQPAAAPDAWLANPVEKQIRASRSDFVDQMPELAELGSSEQLAKFITQPGTHDVGFAFRMLSMPNGKVSRQPVILQALDLARED